MFNVRFTVVINRRIYRPRHNCSKRPHLCIACMKYILITRNCSSSNLHALSKIATTVIINNAAKICRCLEDTALIVAKGHVVAVIYRTNWEAKPDCSQGPNAGSRHVSSTTATITNKKLSYRRVTARCVVTVEILPIATQQCRNYLYDKSWPNRWYEIGGLVGSNV